MSGANWKLEQEQGVLCRISLPDQENGRPIALLLHGRSGDEESMEIFASVVPDGYLKVCPRGILPDPDGGYRWHPRFPKRTWPQWQHFEPAIISLAGALATIANRYGAKDTGMLVIGFSQGAALGCAFTLGHAAWVKALVLLSGYVPEIPADRWGPGALAGKPVFLSHGTKDRLVPIAVAESGIQVLTRLGAQIERCQTGTGHKVGAECMRGLRTWLGNLPP